MKYKINLALGVIVKCLAEYDLISEASIADGQGTLRFKHPDGLFKAAIRRSDVACQADRCTLRLWIEFEADSLNVSKDISDIYLSEAMNTLSLLSSCSIEMLKINRIIDWTPQLVDREAIYFVHHHANDAPYETLNAELTSSAELIFKHGNEPVLQRSMRWFRQALAQESNDDVFQCFWLAIEVLTPLFKESDPVNDLCAACKSPLYCEKCDTHPMHKPYPKQIIKSMITREANDNGETFDKLNGVRNSLAHGNPLVATVPDEDERADLVDLVGRAAFHIIFRSLAKRAGELEVAIGMANTYTKMRMGAAAYIQSVFPQDEEGLPVGDGIKFSVMRDEARESEFPPLKFQLRVASDKSDKQ